MNFTRKRNEYFSLNGKYHIVRYKFHNMKEVPAYYIAYFKPKYWVNFGNSIKHLGEESFRYNSISEAMKACEIHYQKFGDNPGEDSKI